MSEKLMLTFLLAMLGICAFQDWRRREVSVTVLVLFGSIGLLFGVAVAQEPVAGLLSGCFPEGCCWRWPGEAEGRLGWETDG